MLESHPLKTRRHVNQRKRFHLPLNFIPGCSVLVNPTTIGELNLKAYLTTAGIIAIVHLLGLP